MTYIFYIDKYNELLYTLYKLAKETYYHKYNSENQISPINLDSVYFYGNYTCAYRESFFDYEDWKEIFIEHVTLNNNFLLSNKNISVTEINNILDRLKKILSIYEELKICKEKLQMYADIFNSLTNIMISDFSAGILEILLEDIIRQKTPWKTIQDMENFHFRSNINTVYNG